MRGLPGPADFLDALLAGRSRDAIGWILESVAGGVTVPTVHRELVMPVLVEVGRRWEQGTMTVADEHYCSGALHALLVRMHAFLPRAPANGRRVVVVGVAGNMHALSLHMLADHYEMDGWDATLVGANTPAADIVAVARRLRADVVALGVSLVAQQPALVETVRALRSAEGLASMRIVVGGRATEAWSSLALGVDLLLDALWSAPAKTRRIVEEPRGQRAAPSLVERGDEVVAPMEVADAAAALHIDNAVHERALSARNVELQHADRAKNRLIAMAAHELRTPMTVLLSSLELLGEIGPTDPDALAALDDMQASVDRMRLLVQDLLDITHADAGTVTLDVSACDVGAIADAAIAAARPAAAAKQIVIERAPVALPAPAVTADARRVRQVIDNYVTNALKFSPRGTQITVEVTADHGAVRVAVADAGPGVPVAERTRLFKPFSRTSVRPTAGESSTGLGLAIVSRIVEAHGGSVGMRDGRAGGSEFWFELPVAA